MIIEDTLHRIFKYDDNFTYGLADIDGLVDKKYDGFKHAISIGKRLDDKIIDAIYDGPTIEYYNYYIQINKDLIDKAKEIQSEFQKIQIDTIIIEPTIWIDENTNTQYFQTLTVDISHKMVATRAGLGWIGKTDLLISTKFGPRLRLTSILINKKPDNISRPIENSRCGNCTICVDRCPAKAASGELWDITKHRDSFFDAHSCRKKCGEFAKQKLNLDKRICGICISVCPIGLKNT